MIARFRTLLLKVRNTAPPYGFFPLWTVRLDTQSHKLSSKSMTVGSSATKRSESLDRLSQLDAESFSIRTYALGSANFQVYELSRLQHLHGGKTWNASVLLAYVLNNTFWSEKFAGKRIIELGSGTGVVGIAAAIAGGDDAFVALTDSQPALVEMLRTSLQGNRLDSRCVAEVYEWTGELPVNLRSQAPFDVVLAADCLYSENTAGALCDALEVVASSDPLILVCLQERWSTKECIAVLIFRGWDIVPVDVPKSVFSKARSAFKDFQDNNADSTLFVWQIVSRKE